VAHPRHQLTQARAGCHEVVRGVSQIMDVEPGIAEASLGQPRASTGCSSTVGACPRRRPLVSRTIAIWPSYATVQYSPSRRRRFDWSTASRRTISGAAPSVTTGSTTLDGHSRESRAAVGLAARQRVAARHEHLAAPRPTGRRAGSVSRFAASYPGDPDQLGRQRLIPSRRSTHRPWDRRTPWSLPHASVFRWCQVASELGEAGGPHRQRLLPSSPPCLRRSGSDG